MPMKPGSDEHTISSNIEKLIGEGFPQKQAITAALRNAGISKYDSDEKEDCSCRGEGEETYCEDHDESHEEGQMAQGDLRSAAKNALMIDSLVTEVSDLPEWVQNKIVISSDYLNSVAEYLQHPGTDRDMMFAEQMDGPDPCWRRYEMLGTKTKNGREVPNCVKKKSDSSDSAECGSDYAEIRVPTGWNVTTSAGAPSGIPSRKSHFTGDQDKTDE